MEKPIAIPVQKLCCSVKTQPQPAEPLEQMTPQSTAHHDYAQFPQFQPSVQLPGQTYGIMNQGFSPNNGGMDMALPFHFSTPIYNHMASSYPQSPMPVHPLQHSANMASAPAPEHNCQCGPTCSCFGCAAHPSNATTTEYIRTMFEFMGGSGPGSRLPVNYDVPSYPHHPGYGAEASYGMGYSVLPQNYQSFSPVQMNLQSNMTMPLGLADTPVNPSGTWTHPGPQTSIQETSSAETSYFNSVQTSDAMSLQVKTEDAVSSPTIRAEDSPEDGKEANTPTLSPSSYVYQQIELQLPGCTDLTGACQCGDGCACVGCLTHGGHNGVPLNSPPTTEQDMFSDFVANGDFGISVPTNMNGSSPIIPA